MNTSCQAAQTFSLFQSLKRILNNATGVLDHNEDIANSFNTQVQVVFFKLK